MLETRMTGVPGGMNFGSKGQNMRVTWLVGLIAANPYVLELAAQNPVPVYREPRHQLVLESGPIRVLDVQISAGDTSRYHVHDTAILYVPISSSTIVAQPLGSTWSVARFPDSRTWSDTVYVARPLTHRVANTGSHLFRLIAVTNSRAAPAIHPGDDKPELPGDIEQNSSWFLQSRMTAEAGSTSAWYTSQLPLVIVQPTPGSSIIEQGPPLQAKELAGAGTWHYLPAGTRFRFRNPATDSVTLVLVQVR